MSQKKTLSLSPEVAQELERIGGLPLKHDMYFQEMFAIVELAQAFLPFALPSKIVEKLNLDDLTVEPKNFLSLIFKETRADTVYRTSLLKDENLHFYTLLEHKSQGDYHTPFQSDQYADQINQKEKKKGRTGKNFRFSPVLVIIFYHGIAPFPGPTDMKDEFHDCDGAAEEYLPSRKSILFNVRAYSKETLPNDPKVPELYAVLYTTYIIFDIDLCTKIRDVFEHLRPYGKLPKYRHIIRFTWYYFLSYAHNATTQEVMGVAQLVTEILGDNTMSTVIELFRAEGRVEGKAEGRVEGKAEGRAEGKAEGRAEGKAETLLKILSRKGTVSKSLQKKLNAITDIDELDRLTDLALDCDSLKEFTKNMP